MGSLLYALVFVLCRFASHERFSHMIFATEIDKAESATGEVAEGRSLRGGRPLPLCLSRSAALLELLPITAASTRLSQVNSHLTSPGSPKMGPKITVHWCVVAPAPGSEVGVDKALTSIVTRPGWKIRVHSAFSGFSRRSVSSPLLLRVHFQLTPSLSL